MLSVSEMIKSTAATAAVALFTLGNVAQAAPTPQPMIGTSGIINPIGTPGGGIPGGIPGASGGDWERGPATAPLRSGPPGFATVYTTGRQITIPQGQFYFKAGQNLPIQTRYFPGNNFVAQLTNAFTTTQRTAVLKSGSGAAASGTISFCPQIGVPAGTTPIASGNFACSSAASPGTGNFAARIGISNINAGPFFGGTLKMLKNQTGSVWFIVAPPASPGAPALLSNQPNHAHATQCPPTNIDCQFWTPGVTNFRFMTDINSRGPQYSGTLTPSNRVGTILNTLASNPNTVANGNGWGFKLTTGTVTGSDIVRAFTTFAQYGYDNRTTTTGGAVVGNIQLVAGAIATSSGAGSIFNRVQILKMRVPEPGMGLSLAAGVFGLIGLVFLRSRS